MRKYEFIRRLREERSQKVIAVGRKNIGTDFWQKKNYSNDCQITVKMDEQLGDRVHSVNRQLF